MKKKVMTAIITIMCCTFCIMPFSVVKARTYISLSGDITKDNQTIGRWTNYYIIPDSIDENVYTTFFENNSIDYTAGLIFAINFNSYCNGSVSIDFIQDNAGYLFFAEYDGICTWSRTLDSNTGNSTYTINLNNTSYIYLHIYKPTYVTTNNFVAMNSINTTNTIVGNNLPSDYLTYQIPDDRIMAFNFFLNLGDYIHYDAYSNYPSINISTTKSTTISVHGNEEIIIAYFTSDIQTADRTVKGLFNITRSGTGPWSITETQLVDYNKYRVGTGYFIAAKLKVSVNIPATSYVTLTFTPKYDRTIKPIYFGLSGSYMSEDTAGLLGLLNTPPDDTENMTDMADELGDLNDEEHDILSGFETDLTDFNTDMDLDDYDFITDLNDSNTYFKMVLNDVFTNSSSVRAFWVIPLILVIITALLGR